MRGELRLAGERFTCSGARLVLAVGRGHRAAVAGEPVLLDLLVQVGALDPQRLGGLGDVPVVRLELLEDVVALDQVAELAQLAGCEKLTRLALSGTPIKSVAPLSKLKNLQHLELARTEVPDLSPLTQLPELRTLTLSRSQPAKAIDAVKNANTKVTITFED